MTPLPGRIRAQVKRFTLPLATPPSRATIAERTKLPGAGGYFARTLMERLDRGEPLETEVPYVVQTWCFGDEMAMVFLAGEVVVDYALRLKWEIDAGRLWVAAYSNDVPCYIASRRVLTEGGYEADSSMIYYGHPASLAPAAEDTIIRAVHDILPPSFDGPRKR
jgi:neutral ceramidase